jgi:hypothetical protein
VSIGTLKPVSNPRGTSAAIEDRVDADHIVGNGVVNGEWESRGQCPVKTIDDLMDSWINQK